MNPEEHFDYEERSVLRVSLRVALSDLSLPQVDRIVLVRAYGKLARIDNLPELPVVGAILPRDDGPDSIGELARNLVREIRPPSETGHVATAVAALGDENASPVTALKQGRYDAARDAVRKGGA